MATTDTEVQLDSGDCESAPCHPREGERERQGIQGEEGNPVATEEPEQPGYSWNRPGPEGE